MPESVTILFSCVGRRVELLQSFRAAADQLGIKLRLVGLDQTPLAPALVACDVRAIAPPMASNDYIPFLLETASAHNATALVPTIDTDLPKIAAARDEFTAVGCTALIADPDVIAIGFDKEETYNFFQKHRIDTPETWTPTQLAQRGTHSFPYIIKPRHGSAGQGVHKLRDEEELAYFLPRINDPIIQEWVDGFEHTLDVYVGLDGVPSCVVPRVRWQVRSGEVSKGVTVRDMDVIEAGRRVALALGNSPRGLLTLQCIVTADRRVRFIEINPRFGGGAPLGIAAGADYPRWLLQELRGETPEIRIDQFQHGLCMLRYDWSVFMQLEADLSPKLGRPTRAFPTFE